MSEMIDRVAAIITEHANPDHEGNIEGEYATSLARRCIEAMREPTEAMVEAVDRDGTAWECFRGDGSAWEVEDVYRAMIDAALRPPPSPADTQCP